MADELPHAFDESHAANYDKSFARLSSFKDALHVLTLASLDGVPDEARILVAGAGTGAELTFLAEARPGWSFAAVDISAPMLEVCRRRVAEAGVTDRCVFHVGSVETLDDAEPFDAATSILVSQFLLDEAKRGAFFSELRSRLRDGGRLVTADLACNLDAPRSAPIMDTWRGALRYNGAPDEQLDVIFSAYRKAVAVIPEARMLSLLSEAGFVEPTRFFQAGLMHAWHARR